MLKTKSITELKAKLDKQKDIYAKQGLRSRERLDKDIQEKANDKIKKNNKNLKIK